MCGGFVLRDFSMLSKNKRGFYSVLLILGLRAVQLSVVTVWGARLAYVV